MEKTILLVEDEMFIRELYTIILTQAGYLVDTAEDGEVALTKAVQKIYDLILLDIMLPKVTGVDVMRTIKNKQEYKTQTAPVIVITNMSEGHILQEMLELGAKKCILKAGLSNEELVKEINTFFAEKQEKS